MGKTYLGYLGCIPPWKPQGSAQEKGAYDCLFQMPPYLIPAQLRLLTCKSAGTQSAHTLKSQHSWHKSVMGPLQDSVPRNVGQHLVAEGPELVGREHIICTVHYLHGHLDGAVQHCLVDLSTCQACHRDSRRQITSASAAGRSITPADAPCQSPPVQQHADQSELCKLHSRFNLGGPTEPSFAGLPSGPMQITSLLAAIAHSLSRPSHCMRTPGMSRVKLG